MTDTPTNPFGWHLPETDALLATSPYAPLPDPAENIAERLVMLGHLAFNVDVWGANPQRLARYWEGYGERIEGATNVPTVSTWWDRLMRDLSGVPLRSIPLIHEKNLLCRPTALPTTVVTDPAVLTVLRTHTLELRDRARVWARIRREARQETTEAMEAIA